MARPFTGASLYGRYDVAKLLLKSGADMNHVRNNGDTALNIAVLQGHANIVKLLLKSGDSVDHAMNGVNTALSIADLKGHAGVASLLRHWFLAVFRRLATNACIIHAIELEECRANQEEPVTELLQRLARTPDDIVRVIVL